MCVTVACGVSACLSCMSCRYIPAEEDLVVGLIKDKRGGEVGQLSGPHSRTEMAFFPRYMHAVLVCQPQPCMGQQLGLHKWHKKRSLNCVLCTVCLQNFLVDIGAPFPAQLPMLAFEGATRRNRPNLNAGAATAVVLPCGEHRLTFYARHCS